MTGFVCYLCNRPLLTSSRPYVNNGVTLAIQQGRTIVRCPCGSHFQVTNRWRQVLNDQESRGIHRAVLGPADLCRDGVLADDPEAPNHPNQLARRLRSIRLPRINVGDETARKGVQDMIDSEWFGEQRRSAEDGAPRRKRKKPPRE